MEEIKTIYEKESITLDYTAKGFANWTIRVKDDIITPETIARLAELDALMKERFKINVMNGGL